MSAEDHLAPRQLAMFMEARDLKAMPSVDAQVWGSDKKVWAMKRRENKRDPEFDSSVEEEGVHTPVIVHHFDDGAAEIRDGHHRIESAERHAPGSLIPVVHEDKKNFPWFTSRESI